ncbi:MAG TPA: SH3 domain-containing protein [Candidatus Cybelea sp.]|nr:SH3 domain-containing protein [Candidatus Cybelea sp.]
MLVVLCLLAAMLPASSHWFRQNGAAAAENNESSDGAESGLPVPRFVSLGAGRVNVRTGPGDRYPIAYVYQRHGLPVEVVQEFELYRKVRDQDGSEGWVHKRLLSGRRTVLITGAVRALYRDPDPKSPAVLQAESGVQARLISAKGPWCLLELAGLRGYIQRQYLYGVLPDETVE